MMAADHLLHPDHIVPPSEFVGAFMKLTYHGITKVLVELNTVMV